MITKEQAMKLRLGDWLHHVSRQQGTGPMRVRVTGKCRTWKRRPNDFSLPVVWGLKGYGEINHRNADQWVVGES